MLKLRKHVFISFLVIWNIASFANTPSITKEYNYQTELGKLDSLRLVHPAHKTLPKQFELPILIALNYFPELHGVNITFEYRNIKTTMAAQPKPLSIFGSKRHYVILIDSDAEGQGVILDSVPFNAQIGVIGHELCHILDYEHKTNQQLIGIALSLVSATKQAKFEKGVDRLTIEKGLGFQLYDWSDYVLNKSCGSVKYKQFKERTYLSPTEIAEELKFSN